jgi:penicillin amidase
LELYRRFSAGTLAAVAGADALPADRLMRTLGLRRAAEREATELAEPVRVAIEAFCAGVNAGAEASAALPSEFQILRIEFDPWTPADMLAEAKLLSLGLSTNWERELLRADMVRELGPELAARLEPSYPPGNPIVLAPGVEWSADGTGLAEQITRSRAPRGPGR